MAGQTRVGKMLAFLEYNLSMMNKPGPAAKKQQAWQLINKFRSSPKVIEDCVNMLRQSACSPQLHLFAIRCLHTNITNEKWLQLSDMLKAQIWKQCIGILKHHARALTEKFKSACPPSTCTLPDANKLVGLLVQIIKRQYPGSWKVFDQLQAALLRSGRPSDDPGGAFFWVRLLRYLDEEVVRPHYKATKADLNHNMQIKDQMRDDVIPSLAKHWAAILQSCSPVICNECLRTMAQYFDWIDIGISSRLLDIVMRMCKQPDLRLNSLRCVRALAEKGMPAKTKVPLLKHILVRVKAMKLPLDAQLAAFLSAVGLVSLTCSLDKTVPEHRPWCLSTANSALAIWTSADPGRPDLWSPLTGLVERMVAVSKQIGGIADHVILARVFGFMQYPKDLDMPAVDGSDEDGSETGRVNARRKQLLKIFMSISRHRLDVALDLLERRLQTLLEKGLPAGAFPALEVVLTLTYKMGERWRGNSRVQAMAPKIFVPKMLVCAHPAIMWGLMDLVIRFSKTVSQHKELLSRVFDFLVKRCLCHPQPRIRARACYCLLRISKQMADVLQRYPTARTHLFRGLQDKKLLQVNFSGPPLAVKFEDQLSLFEIAGNLAACASGAQNRAQRQHMCVTVLKPNLQQLKQSFEMIEREPKRLEHTQFRAKYGLWVSQVILAIAYFSKGLSDEVLREHLAFFGQALELGVQITRRLHRHEQLRLKLIVWFHRCIQFMPPKMCLGLIWRGLEVLAPADPASAVTHTNDTLGILRFVGDLVQKYKSKLVAHLTSLVDRTLQLVQLTQADAQCDWDTLSRAMCKFLCVIIQYGCQNALTDRRTEAWQKRFLQMLSVGVGKDTKTAHIAIVVFTKLLKVYLVPSGDGGGCTPQQQQCFKAFVTRWLIPRMFDYQVKHPRATVGERGFLLLVKSMVRFQVQVLEVAPLFRTWLGNFLAKEVQWPAEVIAQYLGFLGNGKAKDALQCLRTHLHTRTK